MKAGKGVGMRHDGSERLRDIHTGILYQCAERTVMGSERDATFSLIDATYLWL